jgi:hypothetical protein
MKNIMILVAALLLIGCANRDIGVLTYNKAVMRYGPPDKERIVDGSRVAVWNRGVTTNSYGNNYGDFGFAEHTTEVNQMILTFDKQGILRSVRR